LRVLVLTRNYPNVALPLTGLWAARLVHAVTPIAEVKVVSPVPYAPPLPPLKGLAPFSALRRVPSRAWDGDVEVLHPRMLIGPGSTTHQIESAAYAAAALPAVRRLRRRFPFDLVHGHFTYPDGVVAALVGRRYGVPVVISEHAPWLPWMDDMRLVRREARWAARSSALVPVSRYVGATIASVLGDGTQIREPITPLVDGDVFRPPPGGARRKRHQILVVGAVREVKGVDVLVAALDRIIARHPGVRVVIAGDPFFRGYRRDAERVLETARALGVDDRLEIVGGQDPAAVARLMAESAVLVVPSRAESFSSVAIEALACGTPVVATRCGGPEEILTPALGRLVPVEDPAALADAIADVLDDPDAYDPGELRAQALARFGADAVARRLAALYEEVLRPPASGARSARCGPVPHAGTGGTAPAAPPAGR
jgi:glycosyltransferase involved in cell wall biosynthesis